MGPLIAEYWPVFLTICGVVAWGARLETKAKDTVRREEFAVVKTTLDDTKKMVDKIDGKVDQLLRRDR